MNVGIDWNVEKSIKICKARLENIKELLKNDRQTLREVMGRSKGESTAKQLKRKDLYQQRLLKERAIIDKLQAVFSDLKAKISYNQDAKILISNTLFSNVEITICGGNVPVKGEMASVAVLGKRTHGTKIIPLDVAEEMMEKERREKAKDEGVEEQEDEQPKS